MNMITRNIRLTRLAALVLFLFLMTLSSHTAAERTIHLAVGAEV